MSIIPDARYPIGRFSYKDSFRSEDRSLHLAQLARAPADLKSAVSGLDDIQLDTPYRQGGWTVRQVAHHLADSQVNWYIRAKLAATEELPIAKPYAEHLWAELADARTGPLNPSLQMFEGVTVRWNLLFESLASEDWSRKFSHPESGTLTVEDILRVIAWHSRHHTAQITELRKRNGW